ncbi:DNA mismatch repair protein MutS [Risungbinella massiliensis]|uniref:DNA mismatch repair protein MutS n=1 Tax=Risungbinella massiliensis TaxID=1329796 RepID=UPI0005CBF231|nr:DNA mismatch repair protein MutS [Risungbinella massiliensis]
MAKYTPMMEQYLRIKAQVPDAFLFFRLGDFYEMFFQDAQKAAEELEITLTGREAGGEERIPMCGVPYHSAQVYIERLIEKGYKVAICEQVEDPATAKGVVKREIVRVITPGTVMEESMLQEEENRFLLALVESEGMYALSAVDLSTGECHVTQTDSPLFFLDEALSYQPKEIVVEQEEQEWLAHFRQRGGIFISPFSLSEELRKRAYQLGVSQLVGFEETCCEPAIQRSLELLLAYLQETQKRSLGHLHRLRSYDAKRYMMLDESARRNLELTTTLSEGKKRGSLLGLLDKTATAMGSRLLKKWLDKPLLDREEIERRQEIVEGFRTDLLGLSGLQEALRKVYDLERLAARVAYGTAHARDLLSLGRSLQQIPRVLEVLSSFQTPEIQAPLAQLDICSDLAEGILEAIVEEPPLSVKEGGILRAGYHAPLDELREIQKNGKTWIASLEQQERDATGIKSLKIGYNRVFGYYIEVTKSNLKHLPDGRYVRKQTLANAERFITSELKEKEQLILHASEKSTVLEYELFVSLRDEIAKHVPRLQRLSEWIAELDVLHAFAVISNIYRYVRPFVHGGEQLWIEEGRHPVVEAASTHAFIANDVQMDGSDRQILVVTGPNMAGKSTYMRQVALTVILAQIGCFVPAKRAQVPLIDRIFTRIGAADDLAGGRSTFMVEMSETCHALKEATNRSLVLLDEVGRGTSTYDGMALAHAIVEYLHHQVRAKTLFSTHYHELIHLEEELSRVVNVHAKCEEQDGKVVFLHKIVPGGADRSYGIHVAELAGLPEPVIKRAKVILTELESGIPDNTGNSRKVELQQMSIFDFLESESGVVRENGSELARDPIEEEVLEELRSWDLLNRSPMETLQWLQELKRKLTE